MENNVVVLPNCIVTVEALTDWAKQNLPKSNNVTFHISAAVEDGGQVTEQFAIHINPIGETEKAHP
jgi:hypothetical protein